MSLFYSVYIYSNYELLRCPIPGTADIHTAFVTAVQLNSKGYQYLRTADFIRELNARNWHFSEREANAWIERNQLDFIDKTPDFCEKRYLVLRNMGGLSKGFSVTGYRPGRADTDERQNLSY